MVQAVVAISPAVWAARQQVRLHAVDIETVKVLLPRNDQTSSLGST